MHDFVTVVSGLPRSGTSLMMQMLEAGGLPILSDRVRAPDEDNPRGYFEYEPVKRTAQDASWLPLARGKAVKIVHILLPYLPEGYEYRLILIQRNLDEVIASQRDMLRRLGRTGTTLSDDRLAEVYSAQLQSIRSVLQARAEFRLVEVGYSECLRDPASVAARLSEFLELPLKHDKMRECIDPSLYRHRRVPAG